MDIEMNLEQAYRGCLSVSKKNGPMDTFTYDFKVQEFNPDYLLNHGFTSMVYSDGHRRKDNYIGLTDIGYFDIDLGKGEPVSLTMLEALSDKFMVIAKSKSKIEGKWRLIYRRSFTIEGLTVIGSEGLNFALRTFSNQLEKQLFTEYILRKEIDMLIERIPQVDSHIDKTSCKVHMHSSYVGEIVEVNENAEMWMDVESYGILDFEINSSSRILASSYSINETQDKAIKTRFQSRKTDEDKWVHKAYGNAFCTKHGWKTISQILSERLQMCDLPSIMHRDRIESPDAFMPFVVNLYGKFLILSSRGIHDRNHMEVIRVVFRQDIVKDGIELTVDNHSLMIDEINQTWREK